MKGRKETDHYWRVKKLERCKWKTGIGRYILETMEKRCVWKSGK